MNAPNRPAPGVPVSNNPQSHQEFQDWPPDPFSPPRMKQDKEKKKAPPRPPPPRLNTNQGSNHFRSIFGSTKRSGKKSNAVTAIVKPLPIAPPPPIPTGTLIDLQTPPPSPKSMRHISSAWSLTSSSSVCESGFEDDFSSLLSSAATTPGSGLSGMTTPGTDLLSPDPPLKTSRPTIICVPSFKKKPNRPPPPQLSPPMPTVPPPPPPPHLLQVLCHGPPLPQRPSSPYQPPDDAGLPTCTAMYDYESTHPDDLQFKTGDVILLLVKEGDEWLRGRLRGKEGIFPSSYVSVTKSVERKPLMHGIALFTYSPASWDDLELQEGEQVTVLDRVDSDWLYGESLGKRGIFPEVYVQDISAFSHHSSPLD